MYPVLFRFGCFGHELPIMAYGTCLVLATAIMVLLGWCLALRRGLPRWPTLFCLLAVVSAGWIGARVGYWWMHSNDLAADVSQNTSFFFAHFSLSGAVFLATLVGLLVCKWMQINPWTLGDAAAPGLGLGLAVIRLGCFLNGCCFGRETNLPWGVVFPLGSPAYLDQLSRRVDVLFHGPYPVHPTQLYEMLAALAVTAISLAILRRQLPPGTAILASAIWFVIFRYLNGFIRPPDNAPLLSQLVVVAINIVLLLACIGLLCSRGWHKNRIGSESAMTHLPTQNRLNI